MPSGRSKSGLMSVYVCLCSSQGDVSQSLPSLTALSSSCSISGEICFLSLSWMGFEDKVYRPNRDAEMPPAVSNDEVAVKMVLE